MDKELSKFIIVVASTYTNGDVFSVLHTVASEAQSLYMDLKKMSPTVKDKWEEIGHKLGLSRETLKAISQKYPMQRFFAMLNDWLSRKGDCVYHSVTLRALVHAFQSKEVDESKLAAEIMKTRGI